MRQAIVNAVGVHHRRIADRLLNLLVKRKDRIVAWIAEGVARFHLVTRLPTSLRLIEVPTDRPWAEWVWVLHDTVNGRAMDRVLHHER